MKKTSSLRSKKKVSPKDFEIGSLLGEGAYAKVVRVLHHRKGSKNVEYAVKVLEKAFILKEKKSKFVMMERNVLARLSHSNIVRLVYTFQDPKYLFFVMDLCPNGDLLRVIRHCAAQNTIQSALTFAQSRFYTAELVTALRYLHRNGVVHRDLKPENILIDAQGHLKLADFGTALDQRAIGKTRCNTFCGTAEYVSPEVLMDAEATPASDLWALGCVIFHMFTGRPPFQGDFFLKYFSKIHLTFQMIVEHTGWQDSTSSMISNNSSDSTSSMIGHVKKEDNSTLFKSIPKSHFPPIPTSKPSQESRGTSLSTKPSLVIPKNISESAKDFIKCLLQPDPLRRIGMTDLPSDENEGYSTLISHPFFNNNCSNENSTTGILSKDGNSEFNSILKSTPPVLPWKTPMHIFFSNIFPQYMSPFITNGIAMSSTNESKTSTKCTLENFELSLTRFDIIQNNYADLSLKLDALEDSDFESLSRQIQHREGAMEPPESPWVEHNSDTSKQNKRYSHMMNDACRKDDGLYSSRKDDGLYSSILLDGEKILLSGPVVKRRYLSTKNRTLLLTDHPRLIYLDPMTNELKGEMPWSDGLEVVLRDNKFFDIVTPGRIYKLQDMMCDAERWHKAVYKQLGRLPGIA